MTNFQGYPAFSPLVEIVACSVADARAAETGGANRLELCVSLPLGGLTPSLGLLEAVKEACGLPVMAMVRPRAGGFLYTPEELKLMERDAKHLASAGADGLVFGALHEDGTVNTDAVRRLVTIAGERETVFHRAFDVVADPFEALETLIGLGVVRVLTSGQQKSARDGADLLRGLQEQSAGRIQILPGGGIRAHNALEVLARTGCSQIHLAPMSPAQVPPAHGPVDFHGWDAIAPEAVAAVVEAVRPPDSLP